MKSWICLLGLAAVLLGAPRAAAAPRPADTATQLAARKHVSQGRQALAKRNLLAALKHFQSAYRLWPRKESAFNLALVYHELGAKLSAARYLLRYLDEADAKARRQLPAIFKQLLKQVGVISIKAPLAKMAIWVNGKQAGRGQVRVVLLPGSHVLQLRQGSEAIQEWTVQLAAGQRLRLRPRLATIHQRRTGTGPGIPSTPSRPAGFQRQRLHWAFFAIAAGLAVVAGVAIIPLGLETNRLEKENKDPDTSTDALIRKGEQYLKATHAMTGIAAIAGAAAVALAIFTRWRKPQRPRRITVHPGVAPGGASLTVRLSF